MTAAAFRVGIWDASGSPFPHTLYWLTARDISRFKIVRFGRFRVILQPVASLIENADIAEVGVMACAYRKLPFDQLRHLAL